ncbi:hypothetical protein FHY56_01380 [Brucella gallinifaecis]|uniref:Uncharacterized protein n=1 Tax=Brucella gallinifaecis TaxID=215590 RepID=A0A502BW76_9HYPH|nr:hypothetical protein FHY56_01380 [Brucella gallinifaecis]
MLDKITCNLCNPPLCDA